MNEIIICVLNGAELPFDFGFADDDIMGDAASDAADVDGGVGRLKAAAFGRACHKIVAQLHELGDIAHRIFGRVDTACGLAAVALKPREARGVFAAAFVPFDDSHFCGFANDGDRGLEALGFQFLDQCLRADAACFFVMCEGEVDRAGEIKGSVVFCHGKRRCNEAFHVTCATAKEEAVSLREREGVRCPVLLGNRDDIGVTREDNAAVAFGAQCGEEIGLGSAGRGKGIHPRAELTEMIGHEGDHLQIAVRGYGWKGDELFQYLDGAGECAHGLTNILRGRSQSASAGPSSLIRIVSVISMPQPSIQRPGMKWNVMPGSSTVSSSERREIVRSPQSGG